MSASRLFEGLRDYLPGSFTLGTGGALGWLSAHVNLSSLGAMVGVVTGLIGLAQLVSARINAKAVRESAKAVREDRIDQQFNSLREGQDRIEEKVDQMHNRQNALVATVQKHETDLAVLKDRARVAARKEPPP